MQYVLLLLRRLVELVAESGRVGKQHWKQVALCKMRGRDVRQLVDDGGAD